MHNGWNCNICENHMYKYTCYCARSVHNVNLTFLKGLIFVPLSTWFPTSFRILQIKTFIWLIQLILKQSKKIEKVRRFNASKLIVVQMHVFSVERKNVKSEPNLKLRVLGRFLQKNVYLLSINTKLLYFLCILWLKYTKWNSLAMINRKWRYWEI